MNKISLFHGQKIVIPELSRHIEYDFLKEDHKKNFHTKNKTQYDWFPGKSQNSKKLKKGREICNHFWEIKAKNSLKGLNLVEMAKF